MVGSRTIRATLPDVPLDGSSTFQALPAPSAGARQSSSPPRTRMPRCAPCCSRSRKPTTSKSKGPASRRPFWPSPATRPSRRRPDEHRRVRALRAPAHLSQPALLHLLVRLPPRPLLRDRGAEPKRCQPRRNRHLGAALLHGRPGCLRDDERRARLGGAHRRGALGRLEPPAAPDPPFRPGRTSASRC